MKTVACLTCGYTFEEETDGAHNCETILSLALKVSRADLSAALADLRASKIAEEAALLRLRRLRAVSPQVATAFELIERGGRIPIIALAEVILAMHADSLNLQQAFSRFAEERRP